ncbi:Zn-dependent hydrolase [Oceanibium sediminis]|uniref:Zn-dependent hydrolase n=1 Tax=Oceanibium sediminis TaxID=2026339 RepID=UPI000DD4511F|nr:Zn-dependent hydrolase [Oceanibium sediminis]
MADTPIHDSRHEAALLQLFGQFAAFGKLPGGGISRLAAGEADRQARDHLCDWLGQNGAEVVVDSVGNIFGIFDLGQGDPDGVVLCGSHLDSQPNGGRFDGTYGVACACISAVAILAAVREGRLIPRERQLVVVAWTSEEGARFQPSILGSGVFTGDIPASQALAATDKDGVSLREALSRIGYLGEGQGPRPSRYVEIHVEQGTRLEATGNDIGVVATCWGARKLLVEVTGKPDHTGPTPMAARRDALCAAARIVVRVNDLATGAPFPVHGSVGRMDIEPNSPNTVAERVRMWVELRSGDAAVLEQVEAELMLSFAEIQQVSGCTIADSSAEGREVVEFDDTAATRVEAVLDQAGLRHMRLPTIAGHDAIRMQRICPTTLLFVPSRRGISHSPDEFTSDAQMTRGLNALTLAIARLMCSPAPQAPASAPLRTE